MCTSYPDGVRLAIQTCQTAGEIATPVGVGNVIDGRAGARILYKKNLIIVSITVKTIPRWETGDGAVVIISNLAFLSLFLRHRFKTRITPSDQLITNREPWILSVAGVFI